MNVNVCHYHHHHCHHCHHLHRDVAGHPHHEFHRHHQKFCGRDGHVQQGFYGQLGCRPNHLVFVVCGHQGQIQDFGRIFLSRERKNRFGGNELFFKHVAHRLFNIPFYFDWTFLSLFWPFKFAHFYRRFQPWNLHQDSKRDECNFHVDVVQRLMRPAHLPELWQITIFLNRSLNMINWEGLEQIAHWMGSTTFFQCIDIPANGPT